MRKSFYAVMLVALAALFAGSALAVDFRVDFFNGTEVVTTADPNTDIAIRVYMNNGVDGFDDTRFGYSATFEIYGEGGVSTITWLDSTEASSGDVYFKSGAFRVAALFANTAGAYFPTINTVNTFGAAQWDGVLADTINHTTTCIPITGCTGWPEGVGELLVYTFYLNTGLDEGQICIDSCGVNSNVAYNWLWSPVSGDFGGPYCVTVSSTGILDENGPAVPLDFALAQNYPNPFNPSTIIEYALPSKSHVMVSVFNVLGQKIRTLVDEEKTIGYYSEVWNGTDDNGQPVASGIYFYRIDAGDQFTETKKMMLLK